MPSPSGSGRLRRRWGTWLDSGRGRSRRWSLDPPELAQLDLIHMHRVWNDSQRVLLRRSARRCTGVMDIRNRLDGKAALVTGGSRGIGAEIVRRLAAAGAAGAVMDAMAVEFGTVDVLVNNAGITHWGAVAQTALPDIDQLMAV